MAFDYALAKNIYDILMAKKVVFVNKRMFWAMCFLVDWKIAIGLDLKNDKSRLMARVGEAMYEQCLQIKWCSEFDFTGKPLKGIVFVDPDSFSKSYDLDYWIDLCLAYNPLARKTKKKAQDDY